MEKPKLSDCTIEFEFDGSWNDIYVLETTLEDWDRLLPVFRSHQHTLYGADGQMDFPDSLKAFVAREIAASLVIDLGDLEVNCYFFCASEIEFDFDPRDVRSQSDLHSVLSFMKQVGKAVGKDVIMTPQSFQTTVYFRYHAISDVLEHCLT